jgi:predicted HicB family RNase H-like nuclease
MVFMPSTPASAPSTEAAKVLLRLPRDLHEDVKHRAAEQGTSVNTWLVAVIGGAVAYRDGERA